MKNERSDADVLATNKKQRGAAKKTTAKKQTASAKKQTAKNLPNIAIVGFMGTGKTAIAARLAETIGGGLIDLDEFIEASENRTVAQIIENLGEAVFREIETEHLREALKTPQTRVIALGGGVWTIAENREILQANNFTSVWLDADFELCWRRIKQNKSVVRPLARNKAAARKLFEDRREIYAEADLRVEVLPEKAPAEIVEEIIKKVKKPGARSKSVDKIGISR